MYKLRHSLTDIVVYNIIIHDMNIPFKKLHIIYVCMEEYSNSNNNNKTEYKKKYKKHCQCTLKK